MSILSPRTVWSSWGQINDASGQDVRTRYVGRHHPEANEMSSLEDHLLMQIRAFKMPEPVREYRFHPVRKWRFDLCYPDLMVAIECEGGIWTGGRHTRGSGFEQDCIKYSEATVLGWKVIRATAGMIDRLEALDLISRAIGFTVSGLPVGTLRSGKARSSGNNRGSAVPTRALRKD